jgi:hypothetical protein
MKTEALEAIFGVFMKMLEMGGNVSEEAMGAVLQEMYETAVKDYRPIIKATPAVAKKITADLAPILGALGTIYTGVRRYPAFKEFLQERNQQRATERMDMLNEYTKAGFTRAEAMLLVLQDVANSKAQISDLSTTVSSSSKKK